MRPAVFLDRDGTINREVNYLSDPADLELLPGVSEALDRLAAHFPLVVVTNQAGIARGYYTEDRLAEIHARLSEMLSPVRLVGIYHCPHHPTAGQPPYRIDCNCRKPAPGMIQQASQDLALDPSQSFVVGDKLSDLLAGHRAGCRGVLVRTGYGAEEAARLRPGDWHPDHIAADLSEAADWILHQGRVAP